MHGCALHQQVPICGALLPHASMQGQAVHRQRPALRQSWRGLRRREGVGPSSSRAAW